MSESREPSGAPARVAVIGAGPAGLTAAYCLCKDGVLPTVLEADPQYVGGISRTARYKGYYFDIGGHRFFSKSRAVEELWSELLPNDMLTRPRSSRIYYGGKFFSYPLRPLEALANLGLMEAVRCVTSYARARLSPHDNPDNFEDWVVNHFGERLYSIFFKTYTEKVWGMSCREISADWAAQRIKGLSLTSALLNALPKRRKGSGEVIKTLIDEFRYPRRGPGMMWEACTERIQTMGGAVRMGRRVVGLEKRENHWRVTHQDRAGKSETLEVDHVISSAPMSEVVRALTPAPSSEALHAARSLRYRDFLVVALMAKDRKVFDDNWIYIQDAGVKVGRIQNFKSWSPEMVPDASMNCYGLEYFCFEGDGLWASSDQDLVALATRELCDELRLAARADIHDGCVVRMKKAYPVYDDHYAEHVSTIREVVEREYAGLYFVGRNGMHKYNNQDHSMMTAMLVAKNIAHGEQFDPWCVNQDAEYHEAGRAGSDEGLDQRGRAVPRRKQS